MQESLPIGGRAPVRVALGLGGNLPPAQETLAWAVRALAASLRSLRVGGLYRSRPEGRAAGPDYWNTAVVGWSDHAAEEILAIGKALEALTGRRRAPREAPRPLDIDLLLYGEVESATPELTLPHPRLRRRAFVLAPLADVDPDLVVPPDGATVAELLGRVDASGVVRVAWSRLP